MEEKYITLRDGAKIYTLSSLGKAAVTILFIHGGPGNGCWDVIPMMEKLSERYNVVLFDERGVNKSDPIGENFTSELLVDDIEDIRQQFGLEKPCLMGHSYGGQLLLRYVLKYPLQAGKCIFLCPSFDFIDSVRTVDERACALLEGTDFPELEELKAAIAQNSFESVFKGLTMIPEAEQSIVYGYSQIPEEIMEQANLYAPSEEELQNSGAHLESVLFEPAIQTDYTGSLLNIPCPSLLLLGSSDPVCSPRQIRCFRDSVPGGEVCILENSGHFPYLDSIAATMDAISAFAG